MAVETGPVKEKSGGMPVIIGLCAALVLGGGGYYLYKHSAGPAPGVLTPEAKAYVRSLDLAGVEMKAHESYMKSTLVEITGNITNKGDRTLRVVELNCVFYDVNSAVILRERTPIVKPGRAGGLKPGETRSFRMAFDAIPQGWNQAMPQLVIASIDFEN